MLQMLFAEERLLSLNATRGRPARGRTGRATFREPAILAPFRLLLRQDGEPSSIARDIPRSIPAIGRKL